MYDKRGFILRVETATNNLSSDTTAWWNSATVSGSSSSLPF
ncbi:MAG TPA: hypothetical protein VIG78_09195 [Gemmatimonadaceae bacterium]